MYPCRAVTTTSRARADEPATRVSCSGAVRRRPAIPHCEDRQTCTRRRAAAITFSHDTLKVRENRVAGPAHEHPPSRLTGPARQLAVCPVRAGRSRQGGKAPRACRDAHSDRLAGAESRPLACMLACLLARICPPARWHPRPPAGMPDCPYARPPTRSPARPPVEITSQVQDHTRSLACPPVCSLACPPARWHVRLLVSPLAYAVPCGAV